MATKYFCDRCIYSSDSRNEVFAVQIPILRGGYSTKEVEKLSKDLCQTCMAALEDFVKPLTKESYGFR